MSEKPRLQLLEHRRFKLFAFDGLKQQRHRTEVLMRIAHARKNLFQTMAGAGGNDAIDQQKNNEGRPHYHEAEDQRSYAENGQTGGPPATIAQAAFFTRPGNERLRFGGDTLTFASDRKIFPKTKP